MASIVDKEILNDGDVQVEDEEVIFNPYNNRNIEITEKQVSDILQKYGATKFTILIFIEERLFINLIVNVLS